MRASLLVVMMATWLAGCGEESLSTEEQACRDFADAFADLCEKCEPGSYYQCYDSVVNGVGGDCSGVQQIRDIDEFYDVCLPWLRAEDCANLDDQWELDESCKSQLLI